MRRIISAVSSLALLGLIGTAAPSAQAGPLELRAELHVGASTGTGVTGGLKENDFFSKANGGMWGVLVGLQVLFLDVWVEHDQFTDFKELRGTWSELGVGTNFGIGLTDNLSLTLGGGVAVGVGTGQQVEPPLDNGEVSDKGILLKAVPGLEYQFGRFFAIGASVPIVWGFMFKNDVPANEDSSHYTTFHIMGLGYLKVRLGF